MDQYPCRLFLFHDGGGGKRPGPRSRATAGRHRLICLAAALEELPEPPAVKWVLYTGFPRRGSETNGHKEGKEYPGVV